MRKFLAITSILISACAVVTLSAVPVQADSAPPHGLVRMTGAEEAPRPGDPDGRGLFGYIIHKGQLCYFALARDIAPSAAAHIHKAPRGVAGPITIGLITPPENGASHDCITATPDSQGNSGAILTESELADIAANPQDFYANYHNSDFPGGAVRGQLK